jgi:hypothetical protein
MSPSSRSSCFPRSQRPARSPKTSSPSALLRALVAAAAVLAGCSEEPEEMMGSEAKCPLGRASFSSTYAYFPSDFSVSIVRDTMPQEDACKLMQMYAGRQPPLLGLPVLPYKEQHHALLITVDSAMAGDDISVDPEIRGGTADMRFAVFGEYAVGKNRDPLCFKAARGIIRIQELTQYQRVSGKFTLEFADGEKIEESFNAEACPKAP